MPGTVNAIVPLSLLEAVRSVDIPEGEDVDVEYVQEHRNKRLGLSDTVIAQIRRYKEALKRNQQISIEEASGIARLIGRRSDAEGIFVRAGNIVADRVYEMISPTTRQIIHILPGFLARPLAFRQVKKAGEKYFGASVRRVGASIVLSVKESVTHGSAPRAIGCLYYESALRQMLKLLVNGGGMIDHVRCQEKGEDTCEWRAEWRAVKGSQ
jgi:selenocysteine lyase/cysteine desulfurase